MSASPLPANAVTASREAAPLACSPARLRLDNRSRRQPSGFPPRCVPAYFRQTAKPAQSSLCPPVDDTPGFAFAALERTHLDQRYMNANSQHVIERSLQLFIQHLQRADFIVEHLRRHFHLHFHLVQSLLARQDDLVMRQGALDLEQRRLNLRRKYIDAA